MEKLLNTDLPPDIYNLVRRNITINDLAEVLTEVYPEMEMLFVNQHLKLREIRVKPDERLTPLLSNKEVSFKEELLEFKKQFTLS